MKTNRNEPVVSGPKGTLVHCLPTIAGETTEDGERTWEPHMGRANLTGTAPGERELPPLIAKLFRVLAAIGGNLGRPGHDGGSVFGEKIRRDGSENGTLAVDRGADWRTSVKDGEVLPGNAPLHVEPGRLTLASLRKALADAHRSGRMR